MRAVAALLAAIVGAIAGAGGLGMLLAWVAGSVAILTAIGAYIWEYA